MFRDVREGAATIAHVQAALPEICDVQVRPTVIVDVSRADAYAPAVVLHASLRSHVRESAVKIVAEQRG